MSFVPLSHQEFNAFFGGLVKETKEGAPIKPARQALLRVAARQVGRQDADDCVQAGLVQTWIAIARFDPNRGNAELLRFAARFVRQACKAHLSRPIVRGREVPPDLTLPPDEILRLAEWGETPDLTSYIYQSFKETLYRLMDRIRLTAIQEVCIQLWLGDNLTQSQIADYLHISQPVVNRHIKAAAARLRNAWEWEEDEPDPEIKRFFWEGVDQQHKAVYEHPQNVWDRQGNVEDRTRRARLFAAQDERERLASQERRAA